jgi:hypothetical protein
MKLRSFLVVGVAAALAMSLSACGGSATSPSPAGVTLRGMAMDLSTSAAGVVSALSNASAKGTTAITVTVLEDPSLTTTISGNGSFELNGLPPGTFTLVFTRDGVEIGRVTITSVPTEAQIDLVVKISKSGVIVVKIEINGDDETDTQQTANCLIAGGKVDAGIELEGSVLSATSSAGASAFTMTVNGQRTSGTVNVDYSGASFTCAGVKGTCDAALIKEGARVHVRGTLTSCSMSDAIVKASQIKFQH